MGGIIGLTLGFALGLPELSQGDLLHEGLVAVARALIWFVAFAALSAIPWTRRTLAGSIGAGVGALLVYLLAADGIAVVSLALPLWVLMAIALNTLDAGWKWENQNWVVLVLPLPLLALVTLAFGVLALAPAISSTVNVASARRHYHDWHDKIEPKYRDDLSRAARPEEKFAVVEVTNGLLLESILQPLRQAALEDPGNAPVWAEIAYWLGKQWQLLDAMQSVPKQKWPPRFLNIWASEFEEAFKALAYAVQQAKDRDPRGKEGPWSDYRSQLLYIAPASPDKQRPLHYRWAALQLQVVVRTDPTDPRLRFLLAEVYFKADAKKEVREQVQEAERLDGATTDPRRRLTAAQHKQMEQWLVKATQ